MNLPFRFKPRRADATHMKMQREYHDYFFSVSLVGKGEEIK